MSVIDTATNSVTATIGVGFRPVGVAATPDGSKVYVANFSSNNISAIATATNTVTATIPIGTFPEGVAVTPDGSKLYVANDGADSVSDHRHGDRYGDHATIAVSAGAGPIGVAISPDGSKVYVTNFDAKSVSLIDTATNTADRHDRPRELAHWRGGDPGRQQGLCREHRPPAPCR